MGTTPLHALPYPELADPADANKGYKDLANAVDPLLLPTTTVVAAATRIVANLLAPTDSQPAFRLMGDGRMDWGAGGAVATDVSLYRTAASTLYLSSSLLLGGHVETSHPWGFNVKSDYGQGLGIRFGVNLDAVIYRQAANQLRTSGIFAADQQLYANFGAANQIQLANDGGIYFGSANDTKLFRSAANQLATPGSLVSYGGFFFTPTTAAGNAFVIYAPSETQPRFYMDVNGIMRWGAGGSTITDTSLYRNGAQNLKTDGTFTAGLNLAVGQHAYVDQANAGFYLLFGSAGDTRLSRNGVNSLKTDGAFYAGTTRLDSGGLTFAGDTAIYRVGAGYLKTDQSLIIGGKFRYGNWAEVANGSAALICRIPIYDVNETRTGYLHVYDS